MRNFNFDIDIGRVFVVCHSQGSRNRNAQQHTANVELLNDKLKRYEAYITYGIRKVISNMMGLKDICVI